MHLATIQSRLKEIGTLPDKDVPIAETLLLLGALELEGTSLNSYQDHIQELHDALATQIEQNPIGDESELEYRLNRLNAVLVDQYGYTGDLELDNHDDPDKINFLYVIDRRLGIPVALGALYIELARKQNWDISGLNFPGHFIFQLENGVQRCMVDPFSPSHTLDAGRLRNLLKETFGPRADLHHDYYTPISTRTVILRFCNNRKSRLITQGDYTRALQMVTHELWLAPEEPRLYFDAGVISIKLDRLVQAIEYLQEFVQLSNDVKTISEARDMIRALQRRLY